MRSVRWCPVASGTVEAGDWLSALSAEVLTYTLRVFNDSQFGTHITGYWLRYIGGW